MQIEEYKSLAKGDGVLITEADVLRVFIEMDELGLLSAIYGHLYTTKGIFDSLALTVSTKHVRTLSTEVEPVRPDAPEAESTELMEKYGILDGPDAACIIYCRENGLDAFMDDPRKQAAFLGCGVNAISPAELVAAAACSGIGGEEDDG